jgi:hypothetical protein
VIGAKPRLDGSFEPLGFNECSEIIARPVKLIDESLKLRRNLSAAPLSARWG